MTQTHCDTHTCLIMIVRYPKGAEVMEWIAAVIWKVLASVA
jgi:hypothetical protein